MGSLRSDWRWYLWRPSDRRTASLMKEWVVQYKHFFFAFIRCNFCSSSFCSLDSKNRQHIPNLMTKRFEATNLIWLDTIGRIFPKFRECLRYFNFPYFYFLLFVSKYRQQKHSKLLAKWTRFAVHLQVALKDFTRKLCSSKKAKGIFFCFCSHLVLDVVRVAHVVRVGWSWAYFQGLMTTVYYISFKPNVVKQTYKVKNKNLLNPCNHRCCIA